jgi:hypothetical protein
MASARICPLWLDHGIKLGPVSVYDGKTRQKHLIPTVLVRQHLMSIYQARKDVTGVNGLIHNVTQFNFSP